MRYRARSWPLGLLGLVAGLSTVPGHAGEAEPNAIVVLGAALELPPGTPAYGTAVIDHARLQADAAGRVEDVLKDVAGFSQFRRSDSRSANASAQGANLRGIGGNAASRTLVLLDGVPMADPFFGYIPYSAIVPERLSAIRVTRGAGTGAFGAGAVAGILEMASATRTDLPLVSASGLYGSRDATELSATFSPNVGAGFVSVSARWDRGDGFQTSPPEQRVAASVPARYDSRSGSVRAVAPLGGSAELQARLLVFRDERTLRFAGADSYSEGQDASLRLISRGPWQVDALAYAQARNFSNIVISGTSFRKSLDQRDTPALGLGGKIELRPPVGGGHVLRLGVDARRASGDMFEDAYNAGIASNPVTARRHASGRQLTTGAFVEDDWTLGRLVLTGGARIDRWTITEGRFESRGTLNQTILFPDRSDWEAGGRAGVLWKASDGVALRAVAYTGFRLPTLNELYRSFVVFPVTTQANAGLAPEHLRGAEAGVDLTPAPGVSLGLTAFENRLEDAIANVTVGANLRQRQNVPAIVARGVELTAGARIGDFDLSGSYAYSHSRVKAPGSALDGLRPAQTPRHAGSATLAWLPEGGARLAATLRYVGRQYEDDLNIDSLPGALTVDGFASVPIGRGVTVIVRAENIFNEKIYTRRVSTPTLSEDLGTPRTLWIGIRFAGS
jgi:outer membrane receptor protein involved in Fe transport